VTTRNIWRRVVPAGMLILLVIAATVSVRSAAQSGGDSARATSFEDWRAPPSDAWPTVGGDWGNSRYSTLAQINTSNVKNLGSAWLREFEDPTRATPVVKDGLMFVPNASHVYALNPKNGEIIWSYQPESTAPARSGVAVGEGLVFSGLMDARLIALDEHTGKLVWSQIIGDEPRRPGQQISGALVYAQGLVLSGLANGDSGVRGRVVALDAKTGHDAWRFYSIPGPEDPGAETWPQGSDIWKKGGGGVWMHGAVDPDLGLAYFGVGNAVPQWGGELRPGDNLFNVTVIALELKSGKLRWYRQLVHHDIWDMDLATPMVLYDAMINGRPQKALAAMRTDGYLFLLDRETGKPVFPIEERPVKQDARLKTSPTQPFPVGADRIGPDCMDPRLLPSGFQPGCWFDPWYYDRPNLISPGITTRAAPMSYSPQTGYFYAMGSVSPWWFRRVENPYYYYWSRIPTAKEYGIFAAIDSRTNKIAWQQRSSWGLSSGSGAMTTAGGLLFHMEGDGDFQAHDAKTGKLLWQFQTGNVAAAGSALAGGSPSVSYELDGEQYIAVPMGRGLWAFRLSGSMTPRPAALPPPSEWPFSGLVEELSNDGTAEIALAVTLEFRAEHAQDEYAIKPARARVKMGTTVKWLNHGIVTHTVAARDGSWSTGPIRPGQTGSVTFDKPGTYVYICKDHPWSLTQLIVE